MTEPATAGVPGAGAGPPPVKHLQIRWWDGDDAVARREAARVCRRHALLLWPRLDASRLARTRGDPWRIARLVADRTPRPVDEIVAMLTSGLPACPVVPTRVRRASAAVAGISRR
jgi:hypothetical protein